MAAISGLIHWGKLAWAVNMANVNEIWSVMTGNFLMINAMVTIATAVLLRGLESALAKEREAGKSLRLSEERFRLIVETLPVMIVGYDVDNRLVLWNRECERVSGFSAGQAEAHPGAGLVFEREEDQTERTSMVEWLDSGDTFRDREKMIRHYDGSWRVVSWTNLSRLVEVPDLKYWAAGIDITPP